jgi:hypothetical protein
MLQHTALLVLPPVVVDCMPQTAMSHQPLRLLLRLASRQSELLLVVAAAGLIGIAWGLLGGIRLGSRVQGGTGLEL